MALKHQGDAMFTRIAAGLLLCALAAPAVAQQIYKCVTKAGTEYQSAPCANGEAAKDVMAFERAALEKDGIYYAPVPP
ncbi:DUF4124 domain-containing protein, partial [Stenotrophomonas muris]